MTITAAYIQAPEGGFTARVEEIPGAISKGETLEEARANLADALRLLLECNRDLAKREDAATAIHEEFELTLV